MELFTWLFFGISAAFSAILIICNCIALLTRGERPRWFTILMRGMVRRIG